MKLTGARAKDYIKSPDPAHAAVLIFGSDSLRVETARQSIVTQLGGPTLDEDMRLTRLTGAELRSDKAALLDAQKAQGFFPGHRIVLVTQATDGLAPIFDEALKAWEKGDASLVVTSDALRATSKLRKLFETHENAIAIGIYDDPPTAHDLLEELAQADLTLADENAKNRFTEIGLSIEPTDLRQFIEKLTLYKLDDPAPITEDDINATAPIAGDITTDQLIAAVADGQAGQIGPLLRRYLGQGGNLVALALMLTGHFKTLLNAATSPEGIDTALSRARPPVFGPRREKMARQAKRWGPRRLEIALNHLTAVERMLRSSLPAPQEASLERAMIRLAMMVR